jgi:hypothetical protein
MGDTKGGGFDIDEATALALTDLAARSGDSVG